MTNELTRTAPERIYLCVSDEEDDVNRPYPEAYAEDEAITWATDQPVAATVSYVRADLHNAALRALLRECLPAISGHLRDKVMQQLGSE